MNLCPLRYLSQEDVLDQSNSFIQLVSGVVWLLRNGEVYVNQSLDAECDKTQETGMDLLTQSAAWSSQLWNLIYVLTPLMIIMSWLKEQDHCCWNVVRSAYSSWCYSNMSKDHLTRHFNAMSVVTAVCFTWSTFVTSPGPKPQPFFLSVPAEH